ncbi:TonB-dependent receptor [soil metagenome]
MRTSIKHLKRISFVLIFLFTALVSFAQGVVTGKITDAAGVPLQGATIAVKGTRIAVTTAADGTFRINAPANATLVVTSVGFDQMQVAVNGASNFPITLTQGAGRLSEVVVIGYGSVKKKDLTGSVSLITSKDFQKGSINTAEQLIAGKVAGVQVVSNGGAPGSGSTIRIRGGASLTASNDPLIVVDGVPLDNSVVAGSPSPLSMINPNDIESFSILKDASATAIYGSRASNGVILITTKRGRSGKPVINFSTNFSVQKIAKKADVLSPEEFRNFVNTNPNSNATYKALLGTENTDWQDQIYQTAIGSDNNISVSGAYAKVPYRVSLGYLNQEGILRTSKLSRTSMGVNVSPKFFNDHLRVDVNLKGSVADNRFANQGAIGAAVNFDPTKPVNSGSNRFGGYYEWLDPASATGLRGLAPLNPVGLLEQTQDNSTSKRSIGNIQFDYKFHFLPDLHANLNLGYDVQKGKGTYIVSDSAAQSYHRVKDVNGIFHGGFYNQYLQTKANQLMDFYLNYVKDIRSSRIDLVAGYEYQDFSTTNFNLPSTTFDQASKINQSVFGSSKYGNRLISFFGRANLTIAGKYILTGTIRTDGSSKFNKENRWATFPSGAFAWKIKDENFLKNSSAISDLKLRIGYGITGQQDINNNYAFVKSYSLGNPQSLYQFGNTFIDPYRPDAYNDRLKWEQTATTNAGIDFGFAHNRITGSVDYYFKKTKDLLNELQQPAGTNFTNKVIANIGEMENQGVEVTVNTTPVKHPDFSWDFNINATYNKNKITKLTQIDNPKFQGVYYGGISGGTGNNVNIYSVGQPRGSFFLLQQVYGADGKPLEEVYEDRNRDGIINDLDRYHYQSSDPDVFFGVSSSVTIKKLTAGFVMRGSLGNYVYNNVASSTGTARNIMNPLNYLSNGSRSVLTSGLNGQGSNYYLSDYFLENASFLKMDNIYLGYNVGKVFRRANLSLNAAVQNAFVITKYTGIDPEVYGGIDNNYYPRPRTFSFGLNVSFQ